MQTTPPALLAAACALCLALPAVAAPAPAAPAPAPQRPAATSASPARAALARGDFEGALKLPAKDAAEAAYLKARVHLSRFELAAAEAMLPRLAPGSAEAAQVAWQLAHAKQDPAAIAKTAARVCELGDLTGRSCADAEFYRGRQVRPTVSLPERAALDGGENGIESGVEHAVEIPLSSEAPFPLLLGNAQGLPTGVVVDTGASQTVISAGLAKALNLATSRTSFPIAVAGGEGVTQARLAVLPVLDLGGVQVWTLPVLVVDLPELDAMQISVILSPQQALAGHEVAVDFPASRMRISRGEIEPVRPTELELPYYAAGFDLVVPARVGDGATALFGFDTGMDMPFAVARGYEANLTPKAAPVKDVDDSAAGPEASGAVLYGAGSTAQVEKLEPTTVGLGELELLPADAGFVTDMARMDLFEMAGLLGNDLWRDRVVTLDTVRHTIRLSEPIIP